MGAGFGREKRPGRSDFHPPLPGGRARPERARGGVGEVTHRRRPQRMKTLANASTSERNRSTPTLPPPHKGKGLLRTHADCLPAWAK
jgi:hypothetical protein